MTESRAKDNGTLGRSAVFFKRNKMKISNRPTYSPEYGCYTKIATNMQYFSFRPSGSFVLDHTRLEKGGRSTPLTPGTCTK